MSNQKVSFKTEKELQETILQEKEKGTPDLEIGQKYGVTFRYIERLITKSKGVSVSSLKVSKKIKTLSPKDFKEEQTTVWSFKQRGNWATHSGEYRGNWSPYIPRNVILKYSKPGELVLDYFCGAGTTAVESKLLGRECIALDINDRAIELAKKNVNFNMGSQQLAFVDNIFPPPVYEPELSVGDARNLSFLQDDSIDIICAHPPYTNIIHYTDSKEGDLSFFDIDEFLKEMVRVANESFRVLKPGRQCAILIGDMRRKKHVIPLGVKLINVYLNAGFKLRELVIKRQHNCRTTGFWYKNSVKYNFLLLAHEYLAIFEKPKVIKPPMVKEKISGYGAVLPSLERPSIKKKVDELESTTVWVFSGEDFEKRLNKNVIERYSGGKVYKTINLVSYGKKKEELLTQWGRDKHKKILFIKSPCLENTNFDSEKVILYLREIKNIITEEVPTIVENGFCVIQTRDVRVNGYIESLVSKILDTISRDKLLLREIIVVTPEKQKPKLPSTGKYLEINHQYLLVYEKKIRELTEDNR